MLLVYLLQYFRERTPHEDYMKSYRFGIYAFPMCFLRNVVLLFSFRSTGKEAAIESRLIEPTMTLYGWLRILHFRILRLHFTPALLLAILLSSGLPTAQGQPFQYHDSASLGIIAQRKASALKMLEALDSSQPSPHWPHIDPLLFLQNVRENITKPTIINQGKATNFCGYAAFSHILLVYQPEIYARTVIDLFQKGKASLPQKILQPSDAVRQAAGTLTGKGDLDLRHADQLWFLTLADQFKGYLNFFDKHYQPGDENMIWAATNFKKFNDMLEVIAKQTVHPYGSDLIRPWKSSFSEFITGQQQKGLVLLYLNSKLLHPSRYSLFRLRAPTHFVVLYKLERHGELVTFQYWDYGLRTQQIIPARKFHKLIFGITVIKKENHAQ